MKKEPAPQEVTMGGVADARAVPQALPDGLYARAYMQTGTAVTSLLSRFEEVVRAGDPIAIGEMRDEIVIGERRRNIYLATVAFNHGEADEAADAADWEGWLFIADADHRDTSTEQAALGELKARRKNDE